MDELRECPFCGSKAYAHVIEPHKHMATWMPDYDGGAFVECTGCTCGMSGKTRADVIAAWNRRHSPKPEALTGWISVEDRLPDSGIHVLLRCEARPAGRRYVCDGFYAAPKSIIITGWDDCACECDDEKGEYFLLEGWFEVIKNWDDFSSIAIDDFVTHWMPLPEPPSTTKPETEGTANGMC